MYARALLTRSVGAALLATAVVSCRDTLEPLTPRAASLELNTADAAPVYVVYSYFRPGMTFNTSAWWAVFNGPGVLAQGQWCYTPAGDESFDVVIRCADACGAVCEDTFTVSFNLNEPPICEFNTPVPPACLPETAFVSFAVTDREGKLDTCIITSGPRWLSGTTWFYEPDPGETVNVTTTHPSIRRPASGPRDGNRSASLLKNR